jgi:class 3 adenylate cyclase
MLFDRQRVFLNGETCDPVGDAAAVLRILANKGALPGGIAIDEEVADLLYEWYRAGYVELRSAPSDGSGKQP